jgi:DNA-binding transcriptional MerR regulator
MLIRINELAQEIGVTPLTLRAWVRRGKITAYQGDRVLLFDLEEVRRQMRVNWLEGNTISIGDMK